MGLEKSLNLNHQDQVSVVEQNVRRFRSFKYITYLKHLTVDTICFYRKESVRNLRALVVD